MRGTPYLGIEVSRKREFALSLELGILGEILCFSVYRFIIQETESLGSTILT